MAGAKLKNCAQCGKIFPSLRGEKICRDCKIKEQELELKIMQYVRDHPGVSMKEVKEALGVSDKLMKRMVNEGMFSNVSISNDFLYPCVSCGRMIHTGTYCSDCLAKLRRETKKVAEALHIRIREDRKMNTIERLNAEAKREFEKENRHLTRVSFAKNGKK